MDSYKSFFIDNQFIIRDQSGEVVMKIPFADYVKAVASGTLPNAPLETQLGHFSPSDLGGIAPPQPYHIVGSQPSQIVPNTPSNAVVKGNRTIWREAVDDIMHNQPDNHFPPSNPPSPSPDSMAETPQVGRVYQPPPKEDYSLFTDCQLEDCMNWANEEREKRREQAEENERKKKDQHRALLLCQQLASLGILPQNNANSFGKAFPIEGNDPWNTQFQGPAMISNPFGNGYQPAQQSTIFSNSFGIASQQPTQSASLAHDTFGSFGALFGSQLQTPSHVTGNNSVLHSQVAHVTPEVTPYGFAAPPRFPQACHFIVAPFQKCESFQPAPQPGMLHPINWYLDTTTALQSFNMAQSVQSANGFMPN
ncbi:hypothetical protein PRIPAC_95570, partial [Pristionchus pacificus]|uniref:Uncharacterized protein n=1 Tax=Pristionchus pacificus TaxID=54126 RepID=A0A2A6D140_PRIPA